MRTWADPSVESPVVSAARDVTVWQLRDTHDAAVTRIGVHDCGVPDSYDSRALSSNRSPTSGLFPHAQRHQEPSRRAVRLAVGRCRVFLKAVRPFTHGYASPREIIGFETREFRLSVFCPCSVFKRLHKATKRQPKNVDFIGSFVFWLWAVAR